MREGERECERAGKRECERQGWRGWPDGGEEPKDEGETPIGLSFPLLEPSCTPPKAAAMPSASAAWAFSPSGLEGDPRSSLEMMGCGMWLAVKMVRCSDEVQSRAWGEGGGLASCSTRSIVAV